MFIIPICGKRPYDYYEKVDYSTSELFSIDIIVKIHLHILESENYDCVAQRSNYFPAEEYGMAIEVELKDAGILRKRRDEQNKKAINMALESERFLKAKYELLEKICLERCGEMPEYKMSTYIDEIEKKYHWKRIKHEKYVGRYY